MDETTDRKPLVVLVDEAIADTGALLSVTRNPDAQGKLQGVALALSCCKAHLAESWEALKRIEEAQEAGGSQWDALRRATDAPDGETGHALLERAVNVIQALTEWATSGMQEA